MAKITRRTRAPKPGVKEFRYAMGVGTGSAIYGLGFVGALVYYVTTATSVWAAVLGFFKALVWPAFLVYGIMKAFGL